MDALDGPSPDVSAYAFVAGIRSTRGALRRWNREPGRVLGAWVAGSLTAASVLLAAVWLIGTLRYGPGPVSLQRPPFRTGAPQDVLLILARNALVLALHAMACVAGFIAGSSLPLQIREQQRPLVRAIHAHGGRLAIAFVVAATTFSLAVQALSLGTAVGHVAHAVSTSPGLLLLALAPHALPELTALFLPLAAWILASRSGRWDELLAATVVTVAFAVPVLVICAVWEVYAAPHVLGAVIG